MIKSMTGYASSVAENDGQHISIELKSVNNRFFNINFKLMPGMEKYESVIRNAIQTKIKRGSISIIVKVKSNQASSGCLINKEYAKILVDDLKATAKELGISREISLETLIQIPQFLEGAPSTASSADDLDQLLKDQLKTVVSDLDTMRSNEGERLKVIIQDSLSRIEGIHQELSSSYEADKKQLALDTLAKVTKAIELISNDIKVEPSDIIREVAILSEKADITEELDRIRSHVVEMQNVLKEGAAVGKKLDFICQEFNREFNTVVSKTKKYDISKIALAGKYEVETIREQVQNLE